MARRTHRQAINEGRIDEALALNPDTISTACPYCPVMLGDAVNAKKAAGQARPELEVIDVAQLLARSVRLRKETAAAHGDSCARSDDMMSVLATPSAEGPDGAPDPGTQRGGSLT